MTNYEPTFEVHILKLDSFLQIFAFNVYFSSQHFSNEKEGKTVHLPISLFPSFLFLSSRLIFALTLISKHSYLLPLFKTSSIFSHLILLYQSLSPLFFGLPFCYLHPSNIIKYLFTERKVKNVNTTLYTLQT